MISIERGLRHMAWSNQRIFEELATLPEEIYGLRAAEGEWPVGKIITHFIGSAEWYRYCTTGEKWEEIIPIRTHEILKSQAPRLAALDAVLIAQSSLPDELCDYENEDGPASTLRSVILHQAINHTAEHKGQLATVLKQHGFHLDLDNKDLWSFNNATN
ncbi:MAG: hypothetical protein RL129_1247 [Actinomycetota bacterium]|jgi:uncharacterized damage-inducible protein DinB